MQRKARIWLLIVSFVAAWVAAPAAALPPFGPEINTWCTQNGGTPAAPWAPNDCGFCHQPGFFDSDPNHQVFPNAQEYLAGASGTPNFSFFCPVASNGPPTLSPIAPKMVTEGQPLIFSLQATDPDGDNLSFSSPDAPVNATLTDNGNGTATFSFTPQFGQAGNFGITFVVTDDGVPSASAVQVVDLLVLAANRLPVLAPIGNQSVAEGALLNLSVSASDPDTGPLALSAVGVPAGATFADLGNGTGTFSWTPGFEDAGNHNVTFSVADDAGPPGTDSETITISVGDVNRPPTLAAIGARVASEGVATSIPLQAADPDADPVQFVAANLPAGALLNDAGNGTGSIDWTPAFGQEGVHSITVTANDDGNQIGSDSETFTITVGDVNRPPLLAPIGAKQGSEGAALSFGVTATDPDGDAMVLSTGGLPPGATFTDIGNGTGQFSWTPAFGTANNYTLTFSVTDAGVPAASDTEEVTITIGDVNRPPVLAPIGTRSVNEGQTLQVLITGADPDGDGLTLAAANTPPGSSFADNGDGTASFAWTPNYSDEGNVDVTFLVHDNGNPMASDSEAVTITVGDVNRPPVLAPVGNRNVDPGQTLAFTVTASDPDGDPLTLSSQDLPGGATFVDNGDGSADFSYTPAGGAGVNYTTTISATDGGAPSETDRETITISVGAANRPPVLAPIGNRVLEAQVLFELVVTASDVDCETLSFRVDGLPASATFMDKANGTGVIRWTPTAADRGDFVISVSVTDAGKPAENDSETLTLSVAEANGAGFHMRRANWFPRFGGNLVVAGRGAIPRQPVEIRDADTGQVLGRIRANRNGGFKFGRCGRRNARACLLPFQAPCAITAHAGDLQTAPMVVANAPAACGAAGEALLRVKARVHKRTRGRGSLLADQHGPPRFIPDEGACNALTDRLSPKQLAVCLDQAARNAMGPMARHGIAVRGDHAPPRTEIKILDASNRLVIGNARTSQRGRFRWIGTGMMPPCQIFVRIADENHGPFDVYRRDGVELRESCLANGVPVDPNVPPVVDPPAPAAPDPNAPPAAPDPNADPNVPDPNADPNAPDAGLPDPNAPTGGAPGLVPLPPDVPEVPADPNDPPEPEEGAPPNGKPADPAGGNGGAVPPTPVPPPLPAPIPVPVPAPAPVPAPPAPTPPTPNPPAPPAPGVPTSMEGFQQTVYPLTRANCTACHAGFGPGSPSIASEDLTTAHSAVVDSQKVNLANPFASRLVQRLVTDGHYCWSGDCDADGEEMRSAIAMWATLIGATGAGGPVGNAAQGETVRVALADGNSGAARRVDDALVARFDFLEGTGDVTHDSSGMAPALDLEVTGMEWIPGGGLQNVSGRAAASQMASRKLYDRIAAAGGSGQYTIEAWVTPENDSQQGPARLITYSRDTGQRNFTMGQTRESYVFRNRSRASGIGSNGTPELVTADPDLQLAQQHVVMTFDAANGRRIYVDGQYTEDLDSFGGAALSNWNAEFRFALGNELTNNRLWKGIFHFVAIHERALTPAEIGTNYNAGVGKRTTLSFDIAQFTGVAGAALEVEVRELDASSYLVSAPIYRGPNLPSPISIRDMRVLVNGVAPAAGQAFRQLDTTVQTDGTEIGQGGSVIGVDQGEATDQLSLRFGRLGGYDDTTPPAAPLPYIGGFTGEVRPDVGIRPFAQMNLTMARLTGVDPSTRNVERTYEELQQQLPNSSDVRSFVSAQQMAIFKLSVEYCDELVDTSSLRTALFGGFEFSRPVPTAFSSAAKKQQVADALIQNFVGDVTSQPAAADLQPLVVNLIDTLTQGCDAGTCPSSQTRTVVKAACSAVLSSAAVTLY